MTECYDEVSRSLIWIMGDSKKVTNDFQDEIYIAEKVKERVTEVMAGMAGRQGRKSGGRNADGKVGGGGATGDKIKKPINNKDEDGNCLRSKTRKSFRHMKETCPDKNKDDNKAGNNGEILRCVSCDSKKHLLTDGTHSWENMVNIAESDSSNDEDSMVNIL